MPDIDVRIQWHSPDRLYAAIFIRDGEEWYLDGALVGMDSTPGGATDGLCEIAQHLVIHGENALTQGQIPLADRIWLFKLLDQGTFGNDRDTNEEMYAAIRAANGGVDPYV